LEFFKLNYRTLILLNIKLGKLTKINFIILSLLGAHKIVLLLAKLLEINLATSSGFIVKGASVKPLDILVRTMPDLTSRILIAGEVSVPAKPTAQ
jgi:hypothetical protein